MSKYLKSKLISKSNGIQTFLLVSFLFTAILILIFLAIQNHTLNSIAKWSETLKVGQIAPDIHEKTILNQIVHVPDGQSILLFFFNTTCNSCKRSIPYIQVAYDSLKKYGYKMVGVCKDDSINTKNYLKDLMLKIPIISDERGKVFSQYRINYVPTIIWINKETKIQYIQSYGEDVNQVFRNIYKIMEDER